MYTVLGIPKLSWLFHSLQPNATVFYNTVTTYIHGLSFTFYTTCNAVKYWITNWTDCSLDKKCFTLFWWPGECWPLLVVQFVVFLLFMQMPSGIPSSNRTPIHSFVAPFRFSNAQNVLSKDSVILTTLYCYSWLQNTSVLLH